MDKGKHPQVVRTWITDKLKKGTHPKEPPKQHEPPPGFRPHNKT